MPLSSDIEERSLPIGDLPWKRGAGGLLARSAKRTSSADSPRRDTLDHLTIRTTHTREGSETAASLRVEEDSPPSSEAVRQQLNRILRSKTFVQSEKLSRFLRFIVEHVVIGNPSCLKEYLVGVEVYDRKPPYDPSQDSIVRTEARRLRNKLKEYYGGEGEEDPVYIYLRPGSYIPAFQSREDLAGTPDSAEPVALSLHESSSIVIAILPFTDISGNPLSALYARGVPDELAYALMRKERCSVLSPFSTSRLAQQGLDVAATMKKVSAQVAFEGSVRVDGTRLRITARIVDATGVQLWVNRLDIEIGTRTSFTIEENIANSLLAGFDIVRSSGPTSPIIGSEGPLLTVS